MKKAAPIIIAVVVAVVIAIVVSRTGKKEQDLGTSIAVVPATMDGSFWELVRKGAEKAVDQTDYKITWKGPASPNDPQGQMRIVEDLVNKKVVGFVLAAVDITTVLPAISKAFDANIPCALICARDQEFEGLCQMGPDEYVAGLIGARRLGKALGGKGRIAVVKCTPKSVAPSQCENGFTDTIKNEFPLVQVVKAVYGGQSSSSAILATRDLLIRNPTIEGLFACNESASVGALKALKDQSLDAKIKLVGFGSDPALVEGLKAGTVIALVSRNPEKMGYESVKAVIASLNGEAVEKRVDTGLTVITRENLGTPDIQLLINP